MNAISTGRSLLIFLFFFIFKIAAAQQNLPVCATNDSLSGARLAKYAQLSDLTRARTSAGERLEYRLGIDINYDTYVAYNGDKDKLTKEAYRFIQAASDIFEREINVKLTISYIQIWDQPEPYVFTNDFEYFTHVLNYWTLNRFEERDAVVGFSVRNGWFYGGYRMCTSNFPVPGNSYIDVDLLCHELGHTLGSPHTHSCSWPGGPIDRCTNVEGATSECEDGYQEYVNGSIMSYCRSVLSFHPLCRNLMRDYAEGKIEPTFKLGAFTEQPSAPAALSLREPNPDATISTPSFDWKAAFRADRYRFQIAKDQAFTQIVEDTLIRQSYFQSRGQSEGSYFSRYRAENDIKAEEWSQSVRFTIAPFSTSTAPPLLFDARIISARNLTGYFYAFAGISHYEVEITDVNARESFTRSFETLAGAQQSFSILHPYEWYKQFIVRLRVQKNNVWGEWSAVYPLSQSWTNAFGPANQVTKTSSTPILTTTLSKGTFHPGPITGYLEVATDNKFSNIVHRDSMASNAINSWNSTKMLYRPDLQENSSYHVRSRIKWAPKSYSEWENLQLSTGFKDQRFRYLGVVSPNLQEPGYTAMFRNRFVKGVDKMYVHSITAGYYESGDLDQWDTYISSTTNGKSPNTLQFFGTNRNGTIYMMDLANNMVVKTGNTYKRYLQPEKFYSNGLCPLAVTENSGVFFVTGDRGIGRFQEGKWYFYGQETFGTTRLMTVTSDPDDHIWAVTDQGNVWKFYNNNWSQHSFIPEGYRVTGLAFDQNKLPTAYGEFGIRQLNSANNSWEMIEAIAPQSIRKVVFDKNNRLWAASFNFWDDTNIQQSLISYKDGIANVYTDGLDMLRENFDIEYFNEKLLILTGGAELHTFDENKIQRFEPKAGYCTGENVALTITSNSTFSKNKSATVEIRNMEKGNITSIPVQVENGLISFQLPETIAKGTYALKTIFTYPALESNESGSFQIQPPAIVNVKVEKNGFFKTALKVAEAPDQSYQWQLNGTDIPGATSPVWMASQSGEYRVIISNDGGCALRSEMIPVTIDQPNEVTLLQNNPNPAGSSTDISFYLPTQTEVALELFNLRGQKIMQLQKGDLAPGWHFSKVNATNLPSGVYVYRLKAGNTEKALKMIK
ncbi:zinc-dependent metalloprotease [Dyadobacter sp. CY343]|uniref:zinc-dependent metalloprotease n=1 Tax=Dyadobacter sp. CY343 TaxID=2907299 RepID=UPI001F3150A7|nr:zinc-dependent metalloprotease [Dyadobacter sp. CY343]MCE7062059.1 M12 family metallo-peptidase [Dyadobacter sp. CY343]